jgi:hypothetical protein
VVQWTTSPSVGHHLPGAPADLTQKLVTAGAFPGASWGFRPTCAEDEQSLQSMAEQGLVEHADGKGWFFTSASLSAMNLTIKLSSPTPLYSLPRPPDKLEWSPIQCWSYLEELGWAPVFCKPATRKSLTPFDPTVPDSPMRFYVSSAKPTGPFFQAYLQCLVHADSFSKSYRIKHGTSLAISHGWPLFAYQSLVRSNGEVLQFSRPPKDDLALEDDSGFAIAALDDRPSRPACAHVLTCTCTMRLPHILILHCAFWLWLMNLLLALFAKLNINTGPTGYHC